MKREKNPFKVGDSVIFIDAAWLKKRPTFGWIGLAFGNVYTVKRVVDECIELTETSKPDPIHHSRFAPMPDMPLPEPVRAVAAEIAELHAELKGVKSDMTRAEEEARKLREELKAAKAERTADAAAIRRRVLSEIAHRAREAGANALAYDLLYEASGGDSARIRAMLHANGGSELKTRQQVRREFGVSYDEAKRMVDVATAE